MHNIDLNIFEPVVQSQFKVAQAIKQYSGCPIIVEGLNFNLTSSDQKTEHFKKIFPNGLPEKFEELTTDQKTALYHGGAYILFHLGEISSLYRSVDFNSEASRGMRKVPRQIFSGNPDQYQQLFQEREECIKQLSTLREKEAIERAEEAVYLDFAEKDKKVNFIPPKNFTVLIVYGANHNFKSLCDDKGFELERIDCSMTSTTKKPTEQTIGIYQAIIKRLHKEEDYKKQWIYKHMGKSLVTRIFPTCQKYPENRSFIYAKPLSPTMFTPWGKVLGPTAHCEQKITSQATLLRALSSIPAQLLYNTFNMIYYTVIALPSLLIGSGFLIYGAFIEKNEQKRKDHTQFAQEKCFGNVVLAAYFALAIVVDFLRELCALFSRTYGTIMQTVEEKSISYCTMG